MIFLNVMLYFYSFFFFSSRRRHTRSLCDWISDVCSSDLGREDLLDPLADPLVGSQEIAGETIDERIRERIEEILATTFKPEFLNRVDDTVIFHRLSREDLGRIVDLQVAQLARRVRERGIEIELTDDARTLLGNLGYDPTYGARPLKRVIQRQLIDRLALKLLEGEFAEGDVIRVDADGGELTFTMAPAREPVAEAA